MVFTVGIAWSLASALLLDAAGLPLVTGYRRARMQWEHDNGEASSRLQTLDRALVRLGEKHGHKVCLTIEERADGFMGGFANAVGFINSVYDYATRFGAAFIFPEVKTKAHHDGSDYGGLFGDANATICEVSKYDVACDEHRPRDSERDWSREWRRCDLSQYVVDMAESNKVKAHACGCEALVAVDLDHMQWHFDYSRTHSWLRSMYWQAQEAQMANFSKEHGLVSRACHRNVALHVRLGDVALHRDAGANWAEKYIVPETYITMLRALSAVVPASCMQLSIITDGEEGDVEPQAVVQGAEGLGFVAPVILDRNTLALDAFTTFTHADVLVCGGSGFCRLAAVLAKDEAARVCIETDSHPVDFLPNVTELQLPGSTANWTMTDSEAAAALHRNPALLSMASKANRSLASGAVKKQIMAPRS